MSAGKLDAKKTLGIYGEDIIKTFENKYVEGGGFFYYLEKLVAEHKPTLAVISMDISDHLKETLINYFTKRSISIRVSSDTDKNGIVLLLCREDVNASDRAFEPDVPMEVYKLMGSSLCSECYDKMKEDYPQIIGEFEKIGFFSSDKCAICGEK